MASRYFVGAIDDKWNNAGNWDVASGGPGGSGVPTNADDVFFDAASPACNMDVNGVCLTIDQTGYAATLTMNTFSLTVYGLTCKLVAGAYVKGTANPELDFVATAGTVQITTAANEINGIRAGNAGAGATYQLQDGLTVTLDLDLVAGTWQFNNQNAVIKRDLYCRVTMAANGCALGSGTIEVRRDAEFRVAGVVDRGTSMFRMTGTGAMRIYGATSQAFYNLHLAEPGQTTTLSQNAAAFGGFSVYNILTTGSGSIAVGGGSGNYMSSLTVLYRTGGPGTPIDMDPATTVNFAPSVNGIALGQTAAGQTGVVTIKLPTVMGCPFSIGTSNAGATTFQLGRSATVTNFQAGDSSSSYGGVVSFNLNGFNLTTTGTFGFPNTGQSGYVLEVGNSTLNVGTDMILDWISQSSLSPGYYMNIGAAGQVNVGRDFFFNRAALSSPRAIQMAAGSLMTVGRNWDSGNVNNKVAAFRYPDVGTLRFTAAGAFTIATLFNEPMPTVEFTGGGSTTLPTAFNCLNMNITAGLITAGSVLTIRNVLTNAGTISLGTGTIFAGGGILNSGVINGLATANVVLTGGFERLSGFNPTNLVMTPQCNRLQLESSMTIGTFTIQDRPTPGIVVHLALGTFSIGTFNSQVQAPDGCVQFVSSIPNTRYVWRVTGAITSLSQIWPRDCDASTSPVAPVGGLSNKDLGNNLGWTLNTKGMAKLITDDVGIDLLADNNIGPIQYCWLVDTSVANLTARAAAFLAGANNWHRKTNIPFAMLDNLNLLTTYYFALALVDDRGRRLAPNVGGGDYQSLTVTQTEGESSGGGQHNLAVSTQLPTFG